MRNAKLLIGTEIHNVEVISADYNRGRVMTNRVTENGNIVERFTVRKDGSYRIKGQQDGILVFEQEVAA
jgi:hypothetical protein